MRELVDNLQYHNTELATNEEEINRLAQKEGERRKKNIFRNISEISVYMEVTKYLEEIGVHALFVKENIITTATMACIRNE